MVSLLDVRKLSCSLRENCTGSQKNYLVEDVSFCLEKGKTLAIVGESGSGKSSLALGLVGLHNHEKINTEGEVLFLGQNLLTLSLKERRSLLGQDISIIFQDPSSSLNPVLSIGEQIQEVWHIHKNESAEDSEKQTFLMLEKVGLQNLYNPFETYPHQLSGGMKQRVMIAMALICSPKIVIADEPTTALDATIQKEILLLLKELQQENNMALLIITHDMGVVKTLADDVLVMYAGKIIERGSLQEVFEKPLHPYTKALFSSIPQIENRKKRLATIPGLPPPVSERPTGCMFHPRCAFCFERCKKASPPAFLEKNLSQHSATCWLLEK